MSLGTSAPASTRAVAFVVDSASQLGPALKVAQAVANRCDARIVGVMLSNGNAISDRQWKEAAPGYPFVSMTTDQLLSQETLLDLHALVIFTAGSTLHKIVANIGTLVRGRPWRPVLISGYNGVIYEKHIEGILWRSGCDLIATNSRADRRMFASLFESLGLSAEPLVHTGLALVQQPTPPSHPRPPRVETLLFAPQAVVPQTLGQRRYILQRLIRYAIAHPSRTVYIKPRAHPGETTFHRERHHYADILESLREQTSDLPENLKIVYGPLAEYLAKADLVVTVSSTAFFEAIGRGTHAVILQDLGIQESLGNHFFLGSGLFTTMDRLIDDDLPSIDFTWLQENGLDPDASLETIGERTQELLQKQRTMGRALDLHSAFYSAEGAPFRAIVALRKKAPPKPREQQRSLREQAKMLVFGPTRFFRDYYGKRQAAPEASPPPTLDSILVESSAAETAAEAGSAPSVPRRS